MSADIEPVPDAVTDVAYPITSELYEADNSTSVATLATETIGSRKFQVALNIADSGALDVPVLTTDATTVSINGESTALQRDRVVRYKLNGTTYSAQYIASRRQTDVDSEGNEKAQARSIVTTGLLGEWGRAVLPPPPGMFSASVDTRHFGWMSAETDVSGNSAPTFLDPLFAAGGDHPEPWVDLFTVAYDVSTDRYFWFDLTLASAMSVAFHVGFKDQGILYLNGVPVGQGAVAPDSSWPKARHGGADLGIGTHRFAAHVQPLPDDTEPKFAIVCFEITDASTGSIDGTSIQFRSGYSTGTTTYPTWKSSATPGGCTALQIIKSVLAQVQSEQGVLTDWTVDDPATDGTQDSNGNDLDLIADYPASVGMKLDDFLYALAAVHCDLKVDTAGKKLYVYRYRERGTFHTTPTSAPTFSGEYFGAVDGRIPNIVSLTHEERQG